MIFSSEAADHIFFLWRILRKGQVPHPLPQSERWFPHGWSAAHLQGLSIMAYHNLCCSIWKVMTFLPSWNKGRSPYASPQLQKLAGWKHNKTKTKLKKHFHFPQLLRWSLLWHKELIVPCRTLWCSSTDSVKSGPGKRSRRWISLFPTSLIENRHCGLLLL